jgi:hypothetical protein
VLNANIFPQYYSVSVGAQLGLIQGSIIGLLFGLITLKWKAKLKNYLKTVKESKYKFWQLVTGLVFLSPFLLYGPYHWFVFALNRNAIVTPRIGLERQELHLGRWFTISFTLFGIFVIMVGIVCLIKTLELKETHNKKVHRD